MPAMILSSDDLPEPFRLVHGVDVLGHVYLCSVMGTARGDRETRQRSCARIDGESAFAWQALLLQRVFRPGFAAKSNAAPRFS
jgi:hypothetical protein